MNISKLSLYNFRIYNGKKIFDFTQKKLVIFVGPNGLGKSTIYDAIEWLVTGNIERYSESKESNFNYVINNKCYNSKEYEMFVEVEFNDGTVVKRSIEKKLQNTRETKRVEIDGKKYVWKDALPKIYKIITKDDNMEGVDRFVKTFKASTILSQDEISSFVLSDKPDERLKLFMDMLALEGFGEDFKKDISSNKKIIKDEYEGLKNQISKLTLEREEILTELKQKEIELKYEEKFEENKNIYTREELVSLTNELLKSNSALIEKKIEIINISEESRSILQKTAESLMIKREQLKKDLNTLKSYLVENTMDINVLEKEKEDLQNNINNTIKEINVVNNAFKEYTTYKENVMSIKKQIDRYNDIINNINEVKKLESEYEEEIKNIYIRLREYGFSKISQFEQNFKQIIKEENNLNFTIELFKINELKDIAKSNFNKKDLDFENNKKRITNIINKLADVENELEKLYEKTDNNKQDELDKIIYIIQENMIKNKSTSCKVCGSNFGEYENLIRRIEKLREEKENEENTYSRQVLSLENLKKEYKQLLDEANATGNQLSKELNQLSDDILLYEQKYNDIITTLNGCIVSENINEIKNKLEGIKDKKYNYQKLNLVVNNLKKIEEKLFKIREKIKLETENAVAIKNKTIDNYNIFIKRFQLTKYNQENSTITDELDQILNDIQILENVIREDIEDFKRKYSNLDLRLINENNQLKKVETNILIERNRQQECKKIFEKYDINNYKEFIIISEKISIDINLLINNLKTNIEIMKSIISSDKTKLLKLNVEKLKYDINNKTNIINDICNKRDKHKEKLGMLDELFKKLPSIISDLIGEFLKISNREINKNFKQVSPYFSDKYVSIVSREGGLYILLTDNDDYDELINMNKIEFEKQVNASLNLSSAQSNILALSVFLTSNKINSLNSLEMIALDDPFQNMDDINIYSLIDILCGLMESKQVLVSTHDPSFVNLLVSKSGLKPEEISIIEYITFDDNGVYIYGDELDI